MHHPANASNNLILYVAETRDVDHDTGNPVYLSIADGYVILRLRISKVLDVVKADLVTNTTRISMKKQLVLLDSFMWFAPLPYDGKGFNYYFELVLSNGTAVTVYNNRTNPQFYFDGVNKYPQVTWVNDRVGYQIFPDRFYNGDHGNDHYGVEYDALFYDNTTRDVPVLSNWTDPPHIPHHCCHQYYGGDLKGIVSKLDYLKELGVGVIYLTPIVLCGSTHCYDAYDHYMLHPRFGTMEDLRELVEEARKRGIKLIFDFVPGHVGLGHWAFQDVVGGGPNSTYWNWFTVYKWPFTPGDGRAYRCWWNLGHLPQLNTTVPEVKEYLFNAVLFWLEQGFDGVRIDTPLDLLNPREFFVELRERVKSRFPEAYIVGEIWEQRPEWVNEGPFDSLMNYALGNILVEYAKGGYRDNIAQVLSSYYARHSVSVAGMGFNIIGSHDTDRVLTMLGGGRLFSPDFKFSPNPPPESIARLKLLSTLQYTQPGMPVIFQGDERGLPGVKAYPWEEHRYPIQWDYANEEVLVHYRNLGRLKTNLKPLHTSIIRVLETRSGVIAYTRGYNDEVLVIANNGRDPVSYTLPPELSSATWTLLYSSTGLTPEFKNSEITVPPLTALVLLNSEYAEEAFVETPTPTPTETPVTSTETETTPVETPIPSIDERTIIAVVLVSTGTVLAIYALASMRRRRST